LAGSSTRSLLLVVLLKCDPAPSCCVLVISMQITDTTGYDTRGGVDPGKKEEIIISLYIIFLSYDE